MSLFGGGKCDGCGFSMKGSGGTYLEQMSRGMSATVQCPQCKRKQRLCGDCIASIQLRGFSCKCGFSSGGSLTPNVYL